MASYIVDSCVFIDIFRGDSVIANSLLNNTIYVSDLVAMELYQGASSKKELQIIQYYLSSFQPLPITETISEATKLLMLQFSKSHGLQIPDAFVAASSLESGITLFTYNVRDFKFIPGINITATI